MTDIELIRQAVERVMKWPLKPVTRQGGGVSYSHHYFDSTIYVRFWDEAYPKHEGWNPLNSDAYAFMLVDALVARGLNVIVGTFQHNCCVEVQRWREQARGRRSWRSAHAPLARDNHLRDWPGPPAHNPDGGAAGSGGEGRMTLAEIEARAVSDAARNGKDDRIYMLTQLKFLAWLERVAPETMKTWRAAYAREKEK